MKKIFNFILLATLVTSPIFVFAQTAGRITHNLYFGLGNSEVMLLQQKLQELGYFPSTIQLTGYFGSVTKKTVQNFQKANNVITTGYVGPLTRLKLDELNGKNNSQNWKCLPITQGVAPDPKNPPPTVCGYPPQCPAGQFLMVGMTNEKWPSGSLKGSFLCSSGPPPA